MRKILFISLLVFSTSCISTRLTIRNIDESAPSPELNEQMNSFIITKKATSKKYAYNEDYPVNVGFTSSENGLSNETRYLNALAGPNGEKITYVLKDACCPFPTQKTEMGAGTIDMYEITWEGQKKPIVLYLNKFEKGLLLIPIGFSARK